MVTFNNVGRLGNFMFQLAATIGYAKDHDLEFCVPSKKGYWPLYFQHLPQKSVYKPIEIYELSHSYSRLIYSGQFGKKDIRLNGFFQSEKYFENYRREVLDAFNLDWYCNRGWASLHIRLGDYLHPSHLDKHPVISIEYIVAALKYIVTNTEVKNFMVFSDDIIMANQYLETKLSGIKFKYIANSDPLHDLALMSCCEHNICANSTYSWWGAWLNQNPDKIVIMPKVWFGPGNAHLDTKDLYPKNTIIL